MGHGYQYLIASKLWYEKPGRSFQFFNRGTSGNKITDLRDRWQTDALDLNPGLLSILVGVNDVAAFINGDSTHSAENFHSVYDSLLATTRRALPNVRLVLCQPFVLPVGKIKNQWEEYEVEIKKRAEIIHHLSGVYNTVLVKFQPAFDKASRKAPAEYWIWDGVHPMPAGHELMAREWLRQVEAQAPSIF
jgi:lysophospholipase L1-like esterase